MKKTIVFLLMFISFATSAQVCLSTSTNCAATQPNGVVSGDFNNDGKLDIATSIYGSGPSPAVSIYMGNGAGTFSTMPTYTFATSGNGSYKLATGQFNSTTDNFLDLAVTNAGSGQVSLLLGNGSGSFSAGVNYAVSPLTSINDIFAADFNGDSKLDVAVLGLGSSSLHILYGNGNSASTFSSITSYSANLNQANSISAALLNSDSYYDIVMTSGNSSAISVLLSSGAGTFSTVQTYTTSNLHSDSYLAFMNSDSNLDIVVSSLTTASLQVIYGTGSGSFSTTTINYPAPLLKQIVVADFNLDGYQDLAGVNGTTLSVMVGSNAGGFSSTVNYTIGTNSTEIITADFNSNGNPDIALTSYGSNSLTVLTNGAAGLSSNTSWLLCNGNSSTLTAFGANSFTLNGSVASSLTVVNPVVNTTYTLIGSSVVGCTSSVVKTMTVNAAPSLTLTGTNPICIGSTSNFSIAGASTYSWSTGSTLSAVAVSPTLNTTYTVIGTNTNNCSATASVVLAVNPLPVMNVIGQNVICVGNSATLTASGALTYTWVSPSTTLSTIVVNPTSNAVYYVSGTDANGCTNITLKSITVNSLPTVSISGSTVICYGNSTNLIANGALSYSWSTGAGVQSILVAPVTNTVYSVVGTDVSGCASSSSVSLIVNALPIVSISGSSVICAGTTATLSASGAATYVWSNTSTLSSIAVVPNTTTTYSVTGVDGNGCINYAAKTVTVNELPAVSISGPSVICFGETATLTVSGADTYTWNNGSNFLNFVITPTANTVYSVTGIGNNECSNTAAITVTVSECLGFNKISTQQFALNVFPNPNDGNFTIKSETDLTVKVVNELGQVVKTEVLSQENGNQVNISDLGRGLYFVICSDKTQSVTKKVIVSK